MKSRVQVHGSVDDEAMIMLNQLNDGMNQCQIRSISAADSSAMSLIRMSDRCHLWCPMVALYHLIKRSLLWIWFSDSVGLTLIIDIPSHPILASQSRLSSFSFSWIRPEYPVKIDHGLSYPPAFPVIQDLQLFVHQNDRSRDLLSNSTIQNDPSRRMLWVICRYDCRNSSSCWVFCVIEYQAYTSTWYK